MNAFTVGATVNFRDQFGDGTVFPVVVTRVGVRMPAGFGPGNIRAVHGTAADGRQWWTACTVDGKNQKGEVPFAQRVRTAAEVAGMRG